MNIIKHALNTSALLFLFFYIQLAVAERPETVKVLHFGIYAHSPDKGKTWINPLSKQPFSSTSLSPVHLKTSRVIPAQKPLFFGFEYQLDNINENTASVVTEVSHPEIKQADGHFSTQYQLSNEYLVIDKKVTVITGYLLENSDELKQGHWIFTVKRKGQKILTQSFTVK